jgi:TetR/AcrR family transcriptional regulator, regulator of cefoperazone and chloramphenicol sensitivity
VTNTRERLLTAAEGVFAAFGYREATIQKIAEQAEANIAAVNYHFGDKAQLCAAVIERELERRMASAAMPTLADGPEAPERQLELFVRWFVRRMVACGQGSVMFRLSQELAAMGEVLDRLMELHIRRVHLALAEILAALLPAGTSEAILRRTAISVLGLCVTYRHSEPIHARMYPLLVLDEAELEHIAEHSVVFSLAGVRAVNAQLLVEAQSGQAPARNPGVRDGVSRRADHPDNTAAQRRAPKSQPETGDLTSAKRSSAKRTLSEKRRIPAEAPSVAHKRARKSK